MSGRVKFKDFSRTFKAMYQQIQGLNTEEEGVRNQQNLTLNCSKRNFIMRFRYEHAKSFQQNVRLECQTISENIQKLKQEEFKDIQVLLYKFKDIQGLEFLFSNSRTFKDFQAVAEIHFFQWGAKPPKFPTKLSNFRHTPHLHSKRLFLALF